MSEFKYVSLFSGIGGFEQALNKLGGKCVLASEIDKFAAESYEAIYGVKPDGDITQIEASNVPEHDVLVGGFPCQSFSNAGLRRGFDDVRGTLFFEIARIAEEKQPKALLLENVKGLVNHDKGNTLNVMLRLLNDIGYVVDFDIMNSKYFGVPQNRERIFIVAIREDLIESEPFNESATLGNTIIPKRKSDMNNWDETAKTFNFEFPKQLEVTTRLRDILESEVDEKYYLGDDKTSELVAQLEYGLAVNEATKQGYAVANEGDAVNFQFPNSKTRRGRIGKGIANTLEASSINQGVVKKGEINIVGNTGKTGHGNFNVFNDEGIGLTITTRDYKDPTRVATPKMLGHLNMKGNDSIKRVYDADYINPTLTSMQGGHREPKIAEETRPVITPDRPNKRQNGRRFKDNNDEAFTLTAQDKHGVALGNYPQYRIRKLTPLECWRLQSFTDEQFMKAAYRNKKITLKGEDGKWDVKLKDATEKPKQKDMETFVLNTTKDFIGQVGTSTEWMKYQKKLENGKKHNVNIVIEKLTELGRSDYATNIIKCTDSMETLITLTEEKDQLHTVIIELEPKVSTSTAKYMKISSEENLNPLRLFTILTLLKQIIESKISISTLHKVNICGYIESTNDSEKSTEKMLKLSLRTEGTFTRNSPTQLYKQAGNAVTVNVIIELAKKIKDLDKGIGL